MPVKSWVSSGISSNGIRQWEASAPLPIHTTFRTCRYHVHIFGHSLGGGVAALMAYTMRNSPSLQARLGSSAGRVMATTFGCPPVMTADLAVGCSSYVTSVVLAHDMVARTCIHNIQVWNYKGLVLFVRLSSPRRIFDQVLEHPHMCGHHLT